MDIYSIKIGDTITPAMGLQIANQLGLIYIVERIEAQPEMYEDFIFDGCSCIPDELLGLFTGCKWQDITYLCCLPHDIGYAYGDPGNKNERKSVDYLFFHNLIHLAGMKPWLASVFMNAVKLGGVEKLGLPFSWGFANVKNND